MTSEFLLEAIGQMDDELVLEAAAPAKRTIPWAKVTGWAAAIALCVGIANIPGLLPMRGTNSGATAPEFDMFLGDVMLDADDKVNDYEYRSDQESQMQEPSAANKAESTTADGAAQGIFEPKFFTERGVYLPIADPFMPKLANTEVNELGVLVASVPGQIAYPATGTEELVGCPVWESEDGQFLYVQQDNGLWITARLVE